MIDVLRMTGVASSPGIVMTTVTLLKPIDLEIDASKDRDPEVEVERFKEAQALARRRIEEMKVAASGLHDEWVIKIFDSHLFMIRDPELQDNVIEMIKNECVSAEWALLKVRDSLVSMFEGLGDSNMSERAADLRDVTDRMIAILTGQILPDLSVLKQETILAAVELSPLETSKLDKRFIKGIVTEKGGYSCHTAIMARSSGIPAVTGVEGLMSVVKQGEMAVLDGSSGTFVIRPGRQEIVEAEEVSRKFAKETLRLKDFIERESLTRDGVSISIGAHLGNPDELDDIKMVGADGIGLFRTEFLFMQEQGFPDEQQQFEVYRKVLEVMSPKPVIIRTMDIGGDKNISWAGIEPEANPFLGLRGIRYCLKRPDLFRVQLRALLRASVYGNLKIMFPMIAYIDELTSARALLAEEFALLEGEGVELSDNIEIGMMMEVPSAALCAEQFAPYVDFFSIGTNDLIQYTMAADRMNNEVSYLYQPMNPAVLNLLKMVTDAAKRNGIWTGVCGEMAGDLNAIPVLLGLGVTELSLASPLVPAVRELISRSSIKEMRILAEDAL